MSGSLRAGVIGAGVFGGYHAAKYAEAEDVAFVGVFDTHPERARALAERFGARPFASLDALFAATDLVSIASPAAAHADAALEALAAGNHIYVEKPLATDLEQADAIVAAAHAAGKVAACGLLERAAFEAIGLFAVPETPLRLDARRLGQPARRNLDVSVVLDLMIHDLDLALRLTSAEPMTVEASGRTVCNTLFDEAEAEIDFDDGFMVRLTASRVSEERARCMTLAYPSGSVTIDFLAHSFANTTPFALNEGFAETPAAMDRLGASLGAFLAAVRGTAPRPLADAVDGARALDLALAVEQAVGR